MLGDRDLYWEWIKGSFNKDFEIPMCDTKNSSMKLDHVQRLHITFDEKLERGLNTEFGNQFFSKGERSIFETIIAQHYFLRASFNTRYINSIFPNKYLFHNRVGS